MLMFGSACMYLWQLVNDTRVTKIERSPAKRVPTSKPITRKRKSVAGVQFISPDQVNGYSSSPSTPLSPAPSPNTPMVEIDPCVTYQQKDGSSGGGFCLPSPLTSLLGPRRSLNVLSEHVDESAQRPVREVSFVGTVTSYDVHRYVY